MQKEFTAHEGSLVSKIPAALLWYNATVITDARSTVKYEEGDTRHQDFIAYLAVKRKESKTADEIRPAMIVKAP